MFGKKKDMDTDDFDSEYGDSPEPNSESREALEEYRRYLRGETDLEPLDPVVLQNASKHPIGEDCSYEVIQTVRFKADLCRMEKRGADMSLLYRAIDILANGGTLPPSYRAHPLRGNWKGATECHIRPDWIFVYSVDGQLLKLIAIRIGTHSDVFDL